MAIVFCNQVVRAFYASCESTSKAHQNLSLPKYKWGYSLSAIRLQKSETGPLHMSPVTGLAGRPGWNPRNTTKIVEHDKLVSFADVAACGLLNFTNKTNSYAPKVNNFRTKIMPFWNAKRLCRKVSSPLLGLECSYGKIVIPTEIKVITVTGSARLFIWTHQNFYEGE